MSREASIVRSLVEIADTMVDDYDIIDLLTGVTSKCVDLLGVSAAGVMLASPGGELRLVASSSETMRLLELYELQAQEGPCLDAFRTGKEIRTDDLKASVSRWPLLSPAATEAGFVSAEALPLRLRETVIGALNLFDFSPDPISDEDRVVARGFADLATISILHHRAFTEAQRLNEQLSYALTSRIAIEQAKGVIAERANIDLGEAFTRLRAHARSHNLRLVDVARAAVEGELEIAAIEPAHATRPADHGARLPGE